MRRWLMTGAAAALLGLVWVLLTLWSGGPPSERSQEAGFARDMATHHAQAVEMAFVVRDASTDERLRALAYDIIVTQSAQRGMFMGWLQQWGLSQASAGPRMQWMPAHAGHRAMGAEPASSASSMPGMATDAELGLLRDAAGREAEILFLQLMIRHHEGGVLMARALLSRPARPEVTAIARAIDAGQRGEIVLMTGLLAERGAQPRPSRLE
ncbi:MAG: DUF305 domain-containing protein [Acidobacteria bacterium]|nr:DUF305 domain-containing protein [Acidobacteriota bacterium]